MDTSAIKTDTAMRLLSQFRLLRVATAIRLLPIAIEIVQVFACLILNLLTDAWVLLAQKGSNAALIYNAETKYVRNLLRWL